MTEHKIGLTEGFLIAGMPAIGYWFAFLYDLGYCKFFDIPTTFIEIEMLNIFIAIVGVVSILLIVFITTDSIFPIFGSLPKPLRSAFSSFGIPLMIFIGSAIISKLPLTMLIACSPIILAIFYLEFFSPLIMHRKTKGYIAKLEKQQEMESKQETFAGKIRKKIGSKWYEVIFYLYLASFFVFFAGSLNAKIESDFIVLSGESELVVLKKNRNFLLAAKFDRAAKTVSTEYKIIQFKENMGQFKYERVGPLSPKGLKRTKI